MDESDLRAAAEGASVTLHGVRLPSYKCCRIAPMICDPAAQEIAHAVGRKNSALSLRSSFRSERSRTPSCVGTSKAAGSFTAFVREPTVGGSVVTRWLRQASASRPAAAGRLPPWEGSQVCDELMEQYGRVGGNLKEHEAGVAVAELCCKHGMLSATFYSSKAKFGGLKVSDARKLKALEEENARLEAAR